MPEGQAQRNPGSLDSGHRKGLASYLKLQTSLELAMGQPVYMWDHQRGWSEKVVFDIGPGRWDHKLFGSLRCQGADSWALAWWQLEYIPHDAAEARADPGGLTATFQIDPRSHLPLRHISTRALPAPPGRVSCSSFQQNPSTPV